MCKTLENEIPCIRTPVLSAVSSSEIDAAIKASTVPQGMAPGRPSQIEYASFLRSMLKDSDALLERLASGQISPRAWGDLFKLIMNDGHAGSWILGRQRAGDLTGSRVEDYLIGVGYADTQSDFLLNFIRDLENGRYTDDEGNFKLNHVRNRANLYLQTMRGTSGAAFVSISEGEFNWIMAGIEHCEDCPELASLSPWDESTLFAYPGDGSTSCVGNCRCHLERLSDGLTSFKPVSF